MLELSTAMRENLQLYLDFTDISSTIIPDRSDNGYAGVIRNYDAGGASVQSCDIYGTQLNTICLPGGEDGGYIELPGGVLSNREGITLSFWCRIQFGETDQILLSFGRDNLLYIKLKVMEGSSKFALIPCVSSSGRSQEQAADNGYALNIGRWYQIGVTLEPEFPSVLRYYVDGKQYGQYAQRRVSSLGLSREGNCLIGSGIFGKPPVNGEFANFMILNHCLSSEEMKDLFHISDEDCMKADKEYLDRYIPLTIVQDLKLPEAGPYDSVFVYSSSREELLSAAGIVNRPLTGLKDAVVKMQVLIIHNMIRQKFTYSVKVKALPSGEELIKEEAEALSLPPLHHVYKDICLPEKGIHGSEIRWESSDAFILSTDGKVFRGSTAEGSKQVALTAVFSNENLEYRKVYDVTVMPDYKKKPIKRVPFLEIETESGIPPVLPTQVWVRHEDETLRRELVIWIPVAEENFRKKGNVTVKGYLKSSPRNIIPAGIKVMDSSSDRKITGEGSKGGEVRLLEDTVLTQNFQRDLEYLKLLDPDRMLYTFRAAFGVDTQNAKPPGGWEEPLGLLRGHSLGHYLSALAYAFAATGDKELKDKLGGLVDSLGILQSLSGGKASDFITACSKEDALQSKWSREPSLWGEGYLSAYPPDQFALLEQYATYPTIWAPYYTLHKILAGLLDCYQYGQNKKALTIACGIGRWVYDRLSCCTRLQLNKMWSMYIAGEYGGMNESLAQLYLITNNPLYLEAAGFFDNQGVFDGLAKNRDTISSLHANQHIPQIIGALKEYEASGESHYYRTAYYFWHLVTGHYAYSIGGMGRGENFKEADVLAGHIEADRNCETCVAYNMLKLTKFLYSYEPEKSEYMDYYEKTLFNQIIASQNPVVTDHMHHGVTYMLPIGPGQQKEYGSDYEEFTCCHGTGMENHVKYQEGIYYTDLDSGKLYVNLYLPSEIHWKERGILLTQFGGFPSEKICIKVQGKDRFTCCLRIPDWCRKGFAVFLNGKKIRNPDYFAGYLFLERVWSADDLLEIHLPYEIALEYTPDDLELPVASVLFGPLVMVAENIQKEWITLTLSPDLTEDFTVTWREELPLLTYGELSFLPMYAAHHINYHTYFKIVIPYTDEETLERIMV